MIFALPEFAVWPIAVIPISGHRRGSRNAERSLQLLAVRGSVFAKYLQSICRAKESIIAARTSRDIINRW